jgi:hypothetical protein
MRSDPTRQANRRAAVPRNTQYRVVLLLGIPLPLETHVPVELPRQIFGL